MYNALCVFKLQIFYLCSCMLMSGYTMNFVGCNVACRCVTPSYIQYPTYNRKISTCLNYHAFIFYKFRKYKGHCGNGFAV